MLSNRDLLDADVIDAVVSGATIAKRAHALCLAIVASGSQAPTGLLALDSIQAARSVIGAALDKYGEQPPRSEISVAIWTTRSAVASADALACVLFGAKDDVPEALGLLQEHLQDMKTCADELQEYVSRSQHTPRVAAARRAMAAAGMGVGLGAEFGQSLRLPTPRKQGEEKSVDRRVEDLCKQTASAEAALMQLAVELRTDETLAESVDIVQDVALARDLLPAADLVNSSFNDYKKRNDASAIPVLPVWHHLGNHIVSQFEGAVTIFANAVRAAQGRARALVAATNLMRRTFGTHSASLINGLKVAVADLEDAKFDLEVARRKAVELALAKGGPEAAAKVEAEFARVRAQLDAAVQEAEDTEKALIALGKQPIVDAQQFLDIVQRAAAVTGSVNAVGGELGALAERAGVSVAGSRWLNAARVTLGDADGIVKAITERVEKYESLLREAQAEAAAEAAGPDFGLTEQEVDQFGSKSSAGATEASGDESGAPRNRNSLANDTATTAASLHVAADALAQAKRVAAAARAAVQAATGAGFKMDAVRSSGQPVAAAIDAALNARVVVKMLLGAGEAVAGVARNESGSSAARLLAASSEARISVQETNALKRYNLAAEQFGELVLRAKARPTANDDKDAMSLRVQDAIAGVKKAMGVAEAARGEVRSSAEASADGAADSDCLNKLTFAVANVVMKKDELKSLLDEAVAEDAARAAEKKAQASQKKPLRRGSAGNITGAGDGPQSKSLAAALIDGHMGRGRKRAPSRAVNALLDLGNVHMLIRAKNRMRYGKEFAGLVSRLKVAGATYQRLINKLRGASMSQLPASVGEPLALKLRKATTSLKIADLSIPTPQERAENPPTKAQISKFEEQVRLV